MLYVEEWYSPKGFYYYQIYDDYNYISNGTIYGLNHRQDRRYHVIVSHLIIQKHFNVKMKYFTSYCECFICDEFMAKSRILESLE